MTIPILYLCIGSLIAYVFLVCGESFIEPGIRPLFVAVVTFFWLPILMWALYIQFND